MKSFFEIMKGFFYFLTIIVGLFFLRGDVILGTQAYNIIKLFIMPMYLITIGLMIGYLISNIWSKQSDDLKKIYSKSFIIGIISGIFLALIYIFI